MGKNIKMRKARKVEAKANSTEASRAVLRLARVSPQKARLIADMIAGRDSGVDMAPYRIDRYR